MHLRASPLGDKYAAAKRDARTVQRAIQHAARDRCARKEIQND
jgi:hypothetical protein